MAPPAAALVLLIAVLMASAAPAPAEDLPVDQLRFLAERALSDPGAVDRLRRVDRVDGRPVDLARAIDGASTEQLRARLEALAAGSVATAPVAAGTDPRSAARRILSGRKFNPSPVPRPFRGVLRRLGGWLRPVAEPLGAAWDRVSGNVLVTGAIGASVVAAAAFVTARIIRRRTSAGVERSTRATRSGARDDPDDLERRAAAAERAGMLDAALRLGFRAGVLRLDRAGVIADSPALTTGELTRRLASLPLRDLAGAFEEVAYGGRPATAGDLDAARDGWARVLEEAARR